MAASSKGKGTTSTPTSSSCASRTSATCNLSQSQEDQPLWGYVERKGKAPGGGRNIIFECSFCRQEFNGTYTRVKAHLLHMKNYGIQKCKKIKPNSVNELKKEQEQYDMKKSEKSLGFINIPSVLLYNDAYEGQKKRKVGTSQKSIKQTFALQERQELDRKVGTFFFSSCIPFNAARNPYWKDLVTSLVDSNMSGYVTPSSEKLRTIILQQEKSRIDKLLQYRKSTWERHGVSIVSDGWTDVQRHPLINFIATSANGPIFLKAVDAFGEFKNAEYLKGLFVELIEEVGKDKVVQIITDNAPVCRAAGLLVEHEYPHIFWTPCAVHSLNLALKCICNPPSKEQDPRAYELCSWIEDLERDVKNIRNFIVNHQHALSIYNRYTDLKLLRIAEKRFATIIIMMRRIKKVKSALINMVTDDDWNFFRADDDDKAQTIKRLLVDDVFWDKISYFLAFTEPIWEMLRALDCDKPMLHCVYEMWNNMIEKLRDVIFNHEKKDFALENSDFFDHVHNILITRWDKSNSPLQCMAYSLNPKYYGLKWLSEGVGRTPPYIDPELSRHRLTCLDKIFRDPYQNERAHNEFASFCIRYENMDAVVDRDTYLPIPWWVKHGHAYPTLQCLALRLLVQPATSSWSERNWSTYSHIHKIKRNKLTSKRAEDLVYVHSNLRLLSRNHDAYREGSSKNWDVNGEEFNFEGEDDLDHLNLELNEPCTLQEIEVDEEDIAKVDMEEEEEPKE